MLQIEPVQRTHVAGIGMADTTRFEKAHELQRPIARTSNSNPTMMPKFSAEAVRTGLRTRSSPRQPRAASPTSSERRTRERARHQVRDQETQRLQ